MLPLMYFSVYKSIAATKESFFILNAIKVTDNTKKNLVIKPSQT